MYRLFLLSTYLLLTFHSKAEVRLPAIFGSHMVLQQQTETVLWGWGAPSEDITIACDWLPEQIHVSADPKTLKWSVRIPVPAADLKPHNIRLEGMWVNLLLEDVYFGEIWLCSGQSNMEWPPAWGNVDVTPQQYEAANDTLLRLFTVPHASVVSPQDDCRGAWKRSTRENMTNFSATAYFFGRELRDQLHVPVGLVCSAWGGTPVESWMPESSLGENALKRTENTDHPAWRFGRPGSLYNGMIAPLAGLQPKGFLWYQGETNTYNPELYAELLQKMVSHWRSLFGADCAFYYVQIAPYRYERACEGALVQEQQLKALRQIPNSGMVVINDIATIDNIHPLNKTDVGRRLAAWALANTYKQYKRPVSGPLYRDFKVEGNMVRIQFDYADKGMRSRDGKPLNWFEIAGEDRIFYPASAIIDGEDVLVRSQKVAKPAAVRFAFSNIAEPNLVNTEGLPASGFRTDNWTVLFPDVQLKMGADIQWHLNCKEPGWNFSISNNNTPPPADRWTLANDQTFALPSGDLLLVRLFDPQGKPTSHIDTFTIQRHKAWGKAPKSTTAASPRYPGGNESRSLTDGLTARSPIVQDPAWQGYEGTDAEWTIDLGSVQKINQISANFLNSTANWVFLPKEVSFSVSLDGTNFHEIGTIQEPIPSQNQTPAIKPLGVKVATKARYIRVKAINTGTCPDWHSGRGQKAWMFVDEVRVGGE